MGVGVQGREDGEEKRIITEFPEKYAEYGSITIGGTTYINKDHRPPTYCALEEICAVPGFHQ